eukprot:TRINITY_DN24752_c0_g1_i1.p1 TRINITY_DN24752_c0_g1~~TRINITY_DN24752_c0_g1_i1.p1  ORF type:complete len:140 (+),score=24.76 TRINITY_DN24752_c0_g1_i1:311-730(+)
MSTHEMCYLDNPLEPMECQVSMVTHHQHTPEDRLGHEGEVPSMVCHQAIHDTIDYTQEEAIKKTEILSTMNLSKTEEVVMTADSSISSSMVAHQLPPLDTLLESPDMPSSMAAHVSNTHSMDEGEERSEYFYGSSSNYK